MDSKLKVPILIPWLVTPPPINNEGPDLMKTTEHNLQTQPDFFQPLVQKMNEGNCWKRASLPRSNMHWAWLLLFVCFCSWVKYWSTFGPSVTAFSVEVRPQKALKVSFLLSSPLSRSRAHHPLCRHNWQRTVALYAAWNVESFQLPQESNKLSCVGV